MIVDSSLLIRRTAIAYLHAQIPGAASQRQDNIQFFEEINSSGLDFPDMQQTGSELVLLNRATAERISEIRVGNFSPIPPGSVPPGVQVPTNFRLLFAEQNSPKPLKFTLDAADAAHEAMLKVWGSRLGTLTLVEVSMVATTQLNHAEGAGAYLRDRVTRVGDVAENRLGRKFDQVSVKLNSHPPIAFGDNPQPPAIPGAQVELSLEALPPEQKLVVITLLVKWPLIQLRLRDLQLPLEVRTALGDREFLELNHDLKPPTFYVEQVYNYLQNNVLSFLEAVGR